MDDPSARYLEALAAFASGDLVRVQRALSPSVRAVWGGESSYSGEYLGVGAVMALVARIRDWFEPASVAVESITPVEDGLAIVQTATMRDVMSGDSVEGARFRLTIRFDDANRIAFFENVPIDPERIDGFLNRRFAQDSP